MILALKLREDEQNVLVVGHSNTTPQLIEMLTGAVIPEMSDSDYQELYQIQYIDGYTYLTTLKQPLTCQ
jgi:bisphosphoglycerate-dependent phosphoglycerate mutase